MVEKTKGYANHTPELTVHVYGFSSDGARDELAYEIKDVIRKFRRNNREKALERKIALD